MTYPQLIGFDMDGVIIDSLECMKDAWHLTCREHHIDISFDDFKKNIGKPLGVILRDLEVDSSMRYSVSSTYISSTRQFAHKIRVEKSILDFIFAATEKGCKCVIITSKPRERAQEIVSQIGLWNIKLICPEDTGRGKPYGDPLIKANVDTGIGKSNSLYIGDMESDYLAACAAGWKFAYAAWGYGHMGENKIDYLRIDSPSDVWRILD